MRAHRRLDKWVSRLTIVGMTKAEAISLFGSVKELAKAYGCKRQAIYQWPADLPQGIADRVLGAAVRTRSTPPGTTTELPSTQKLEKSCLK